MSPTAAVVIGRNEAGRLARSLAAARRGAAPVVYVDSGSTDASVEIAREMGVDVVALGDAAPHSAARGRNAGWRRALDLAPQTELVQFVDGDSELAEAWLAAGAAALRERPDAGAVSGWVRERAPRRSLWHRLRDAASDRTVGEIRGCGGNAMIRVAALRAAGGFEEIAAGEDFDLCLRLRHQGWKTLRVAHDMASHDSGDLDARRWWTRSVRDGLAYATIVARHWRDPERPWVREWASIWLWGAVVPLATAAALGLVGRVGLLLLGAYPVLLLRTYRGLRRRGLEAADARLFALFCVIGKFPQMIGQARFLSRFPPR